VVPAGAVNKGSVGKKITPVVRPNETPIGFKIDDARNAFLNQTRGSNGVGKNGATTIQPLDEGGGVGDGDGSQGDTDHGNDDAHQGDGHDGDGDHDNDHDGHYDGDHYTHNDYYYGNHYYYTHASAPYGWWYLYGDYDGDGYTDYVVTNGSYSIYWYGWSGSYWGASPWYGWYGSGYGYPYSWWYYSVSDRYRGTIYGADGDLSNDPSYSTTPADTQAMPEAMPLSALEVARLEMSIGETDGAIEAYRSHLSEYPSDWLAIRELGLAMIRVGNRGDGIAMIGYAYSMDPTLAYDAVPVSLFEESDKLLRDAVIGSVGWGHRNPSASGWLSVAVLMQAEGRDGPALRMIERAVEYGLDSAVAEEMTKALSRR